MMKRICFCLAALFCLNVVLWFPATALTDHTNVVIGTPSSPYTHYRIPGIVVTQNDTVLAYWEARRTNDTDEGDTDIMILRSANSGENFESVLTIESSAETCLTNPMMIVGNDGTIHLLYAENTGKNGVWYRYSTKEQDGTVWSDPIDISACLKRDTLGWSMVNFGPGHGICLQNGKNAGRLLLPMWCYFNGKYHVYTVYSDDSGTTWQMGEYIEGLYDETMIAELSDGGVLLNARQYGHSYDTQGENYKPATQADAYRHLSFSSTGIDSWSDVRKDTQLPDPACQGSMLSTTINKKHAILFTNCNNQSGRSNLTVRCSFDDGKTWVNKTILVDKVGGYSDIAVDREGTAYVLHEAMTNGCHIIKLYRFDLIDEFAFYTNSVSVFEGSGTEIAPYLLEHMGDLNTLQNSESNYAGKHFKLCFDPDFKFDESNWNGIGSKTLFVGSFVGNGHTVKNLLGSFFADADDSKIADISYQNRLFSNKNYYQVGDTEDFRVRFAADLNCDVSLLREVGFEYEITYGTQTKKFVASCSQIYEKLTVDGIPQAPFEGKYFLAHGIKNIPESMPVSFTVRPYAKTTNNETYYGSKTSISFVDRNGLIGLMVSNGDCSYLPWDSVFQ